MHKVINKSNDSNWDMIIKKYLDQCIDKEIDIEFCNPSDVLIGKISDIMVEEYTITREDLSYHYNLIINDNIKLRFNEIELDCGLLYLKVKNEECFYISLSNYDDIVEPTLYDKEIINNVIAFTDNFECIDCPMYDKKNITCKYENCPFEEVADTLKKL